MKKRVSKRQIMEHYYSDEELNVMLRTTVRQRLAWLTKAIRLSNKLTPRRAKKLQEQLGHEGW